MKDNIYGRYTLDPEWHDILMDSNLEEDNDYQILEDKIYLYVPTDIKKLEDFINKLFSITESD